MGVHTRDGLARLLQGYLDVGDQLQVDIDDVIGRGLIVVDQEDGERRGQADRGRRFGLRQHRLAAALPARA